jgi:hypothetical protein
MTLRGAFLIGLIAVAGAGCGTTWQANDNGSALTSPTTVRQCRDGVYNRAAAMCLSPGSQ